MRFTCLIVYDVLIVYRCDFIELALKSARQKKPEEAIAGDPHLWSTVSLVPLLIGPPSHRSPVSLAPLLMDIGLITDTHDGLRIVQNFSKTIITIIWMTKSF